MGPGARGRRNKLYKSQGALEQKLGSTNITALPRIGLLGPQPSATSPEGMGHRPCPWLRKKTCGWPPLRVRSTQASARTTAPLKGSHLPEMLSLEHLTPRRRLSFSTETSAMGDTEGTRLGGRGVVQH